MPTEVFIDLPAPHAGQLRVIREAERFNVLECGRRFGKTTLGQRLLVKSGLRGHSAAWFAPTYKLLSEVWRELVRLLKPATADVSQQEKRLALVTGGVLECWSLDDDDAGRGRKYHRVVVDEAGIVRNLESAWVGAIRPTLTDYKGDGWFLGTPKGRNYFHRLFGYGESGRAGWKSFRLPTTANPTIDPAEIESARQDMPEAAYNQEFLGIPADDGGNPFDLSAVRACTVPAVRPGPPAVYGVDLAKKQDWTVPVGLNAAGGVCHLDRWQSDWAKTTRTLTTLLGKTPALVDSTGVGDPIVEALQRELPNVEGFKFTAPSKQQIMEGLAAAIQRREIQIPEGWLTAELESFEYQYRPGGVRYSAPDGMTDDGVCALALAVEKLNRFRHHRARMGGGGIFIT